MLRILISLREGSKDWSQAEATEFKNYSASANMEMTYYISINISPKFVIKMHNNLRRTCLSTSLSSSSGLEKERWKPDIFAQNYLSEKWTWTFASLYDCVRVT